MVRHAAHRRLLLDGHTGAGRAPAHACTDLELAVRRGVRHCHHARAFVGRELRLRCRRLLSDARLVRGVGMVHVGVHQDTGGKAGAGPARQRAARALPGLQCARRPHADLRDLLPVHRRRRRTARHCQRGGQLHDLLGPGLGQRRAADLHRRRRHFLRAGARRGHHDLFRARHVGSHPLVAALSGPDLRARHAVRATGSRRPHGPACAQGQGRRLEAPHCALPALPRRRPAADRRPGIRRREHPRRAVGRLSREDEQRPKANGCPTSCSGERSSRPRPRPGPFRSCCWRSAAGSCSRYGASPRAHGSLPRESCQASRPHRLHRSRQLRHTAPAAAAGQGASS